MCAARSPSHAFCALCLWQEISPCRAARAPLAASGAVPGSGFTITSIMDGRQKASSSSHTIQLAISRTFGTPCSAFSPQRNSQEKFILFLRGGTAHGYTFHTLHPHAPLPVPLQ